VDFDFSAKGGSPAADQNAFPTRGSMQDQTKKKRMISSNPGRHHCLP
jgi:hypothetical protein